ncbi:hypothetical protein DN310_26665 [Salmonella enterica subsp. salamae]|uniref:Uncharacterized protein n=1 Tax=Salmonella enterica subsp. salamae TaxID=59202 RepID=A0A5Y3MZM3_SALER|nr:hypothetical protein [Salmonella enterica subsp. salamae]
MYGGAEFGTGNKEREHIIDQATAFLVANSISRFIPVGFDELSQLNVRIFMNGDHPITVFFMVIRN